MRDWLNQNGMAQEGTPEQIKWYNRSGRYLLMKTTIGSR